SRDYSLRYTIRWQGYDDPREDTLEREAHITCYRPIVMYWLSLFPPSHNFLEELRAHPCFNELPMNVQLTIGALVVNFLQGASLRFIGMDDITPKMLYVAVNNSDMFGPPRYSDLNALCTAGERRNELEVNTAVQFNNYPFWEDSSTLTSFASSDVLLLDELPTVVDQSVARESLFTETEAVTFASFIALPDGKCLDRRLVWDLSRFITHS
ncbi:hypothetical protein OSTOST_12125, partial [Ostertagia ostertagi]